MAREGADKRVVLLAEMERDHELILGQPRSVDQDVVDWNVAGCATARQFGILLMRLPIRGESSRIKAQLGTTSGFRTSISTFTACTSNVRMEGQKAVLPRLITNEREPGKTYPPPIRLAAECEVAEDRVGRDDLGTRHDSWRPSRTGPPSLWTVANRSNRPRVVHPEVKVELVDRPQAGDLQEQGPPVPERRPPNGSPRDHVPGMLGGWGKFPRAVTRPIAKAPGSCELGSLRWPRPPPDRRRARRNGGRAFHSRGVAERHRQLDVILGVADPLERAASAGGTAPSRSCR